MGLPRRAHRRPDLLPDHELERGPRRLVGPVRDLARRPRASGAASPPASLAGIWVLHRRGANIPLFMDCVAPGAARRAGDRPRRQLVQPGAVRRPDLAAVGPRDRPRAPPARLPERRRPSTRRSSTRSSGTSGWPRSSSGSATTGGSARRGCSRSTSRATRSGASARSCCASTPPTTSSGCGSTSSSRSRCSSSASCGSSASSAARASRTRAPTRGRPARPPRASRGADGAPRPVASHRRRRHGVLGRQLLELLGLALGDPPSRPRRRSTGRTRRYSPAATGSPTNSDRSAPSSAFAIGPGELRRREERDHAPRSRPGRRRCPRQPQRP